MTAFYNDIDPYACEWTRALMAAGLITEGTVDGRPIQEVEPQDLAGHTRHHFFSGIAGWDHALALAGWPEDRPVWTASLPCQGFSSAGKRKGAADDRHLWPVFFRLVRQCRPDTVFGEQVSGAIGFGWLDGVRTDLESEGYAVGAAVLTAAGAGAPHIRQRLYWVAERQPVRLADSRRTIGERDARGVPRAEAEGQGERLVDGDRPVGPEHGGATGGTPERMGDPDGAGPQGWRGGRHGTDERPAGASGVAGGSLGGMGDPDGQRLEGRAQRDEREAGRLGAPRRADAVRPGVRAGGLADSDRRDAAQEPPGDQAVRGQREEVGGRAEQSAGPRAGGGTGGGADPRRTARGRHGEDAAGAGDRGVADARGELRQRGADQRGPAGEGPPVGGEEGVHAERGGADRGVGDAEGVGRSPAARHGEADQDRPADADTRTDGQLQARPGRSGGHGFWDEFDLIPCRDGKVRRVEPGSFPLAHGFPRSVGRLLAALGELGVDPRTARRLVRDARSVVARAGKNRTGRLKGYGNAICPQTAAMFIRAYMETRGIT